MTDLTPFTKELEVAEAEYSHASRTLTEESAAWELVKQKQTDALTAQKLLQEVAQTVQEIAHTRLASVVTRCLKAVFGEEGYEFRITFERKRGKTEARLSFVRDGKEIDPLEAAGGGTVDIAAFALRIACLMMSVPKQRKLIVLDEPFRFLSKKYREQARLLLETLSSELEMQIIMVTHAKEFMVGKVVEL